jgi:hypothetical protein
VKSELLLLTLLWAITLTGFSAAVNARGPARISISYFIAILCLCGAVFHTSQYLAESNSTQAAVIDPTVPVVENVPQVVLPSAEDTAGLAASKQALITAAARTEMKGALDLAKRLAERLIAVDLGRVSDLSDAEYDAMQNKSFSFKSDVGKVKERLSGLSVTLPGGLQEPAAKIQGAVGQLSQAVQDYDRFFKAENDDEEAKRKQAYQQLTQSALSALKQAEAELSTP